MIIQNERLIKCPHCGSAVIDVEEVDFMDGRDEAYRIACNCGRAYFRLHGWYANMNQLITDWNNLNQTVEFQEVQDGVLV